MRKKNQEGDSRTRTKNYNNTFYKKVQKIAETLEIDTDKVTDKKNHYGKRK